MGKGQGGEYLDCLAAWNNWDKNTDLIWNSGGHVRCRTMTAHTYWHCTSWWWCPVQNWRVWVAHPSLSLMKGNCHLHLLEEEGGQAEEYVSVVWDSLRSNEWTTAPKQSRTFTYSNTGNYSFRWRSQITLWIWVRESHHIISPRISLWLGHKSGVVFRQNSLTCTPVLY